MQNTTLTCMNPTVIVSTHAISIFVTDVVETSLSSIFFTYELLPLIELAISSTAIPDIKLIKANVP